MARVCRTNVNFGTDPVVWNVTRRNFKRRTASYGENRTAVHTHIGFLCRVRCTRRVRGGGLRFDSASRGADDRERASRKTRESYFEKTGDFRETGTHRDEDTRWTGWRGIERPAGLVTRDERHRREKTLLVGFGSVFSSEKKVRTGGPPAFAVAAAVN